MSTTRSRSLFALLAALSTMSVGYAGTADHFILTHVASLAFARMDPIVDPGSMSNHVHNIMGGSNFNYHLNTPEQMVASECSSTIVGDDKSNYWAPLLYYRYENNTYAPMLGQNRIYYFNKAHDVQPFPPGLRMISGTAGVRDVNDKRSMGVKISCNHGLQTKFLPNGKTHPGGCQALSLGIYFPSCGLASGDLDSPDHFSHMAWPQAYNGPNLVDEPNGWKCPESHPIKYPTIFMETNYYTGFNQPWRNDDNLLVLSTGDSVGSSFHADFHNGWVQSTLKETLEQCGHKKGPGDRLGECAPLRKSSDYWAAYKCRYQNEIPAEDVGLMAPIARLPGCNPLWTAEMGDRKPPCTNTRGNPEYVSPNVAFQNLLYKMHIPLAATWAPVKENLRQLIPGLGMRGASKILPWGESGGSNDAKLKISSLDEVKAAAVRLHVPAEDAHVDAPQGNSTTASPPAESPTGSSTSVSPPASTSAGSGAGQGNNLVGVPDDDSEEATTSTTSVSSTAVNTSATSTSASGSATTIKGPAKTCVRRAGAKREKVRRHIQAKHKRVQHGH